MLDYQQNDPGRLVLAKNEGYKQSHILQNKTQATAPAITDTRPLEAKVFMFGPVFANTGSILNENPLTHSFALTGWPTHLVFKWP